jgi:hypothetical protein
LDDPGPVWRVLRPSGAPVPLVADVDLGMLRIHAPDGAAPRLVERARLPLPTAATVERGALHLRSPLPRPPLTLAGGSSVLASPPERFGSRRLRVSLVRLEPSGAARVEACWARLPQAERLLEDDVLDVDGAPMLVVATRPADRLAIFGEKQLRLFPLRRDRSRLGLAPSYATESRMNLWQSGTYRMADVDADGRADLVVGYWKGIKDDTVVLDAYLRREDGGFAKSPRSTAFDVEDADTEWLEYGADVDGDGLSDLLIGDGERLLLHRGRPSEDGRRIVERQPLAVALGAPFEGDGLRVVAVSTGGIDSWSEQRPDRTVALEDLDGDGASEILVVRHGDDDGPGALLVVRVER